MFFKRLLCGISRLTKIFGHEDQTVLGRVGLWCCIADSLTRLCVYLQLNQDLIWSSKITLLTPHASAASGQQVLTRDGAVDGITRPG